MSVFGLTGGENKIGPLNSSPPAYPPPPRLLSTVGLLRAHCLIIEVINKDIKHHHPLRETTSNSLSQV